jgi:hypothetical protein
MLLLAFELVNLPVPLIPSQNTTRVSNEINLVGISVGIPIEINFDFRRNYWSKLSKVPVIGISTSISTVEIEIPISTSKFYEINISSEFRFVENKQSKSKLRFRHINWKKISENRNIEFSTKLGYNFFGIPILSKVKKNDFRVDYTNFFLWK